MYYLTDYALSDYQTQTLAISFLIHSDPPFCSDIIFYVICCFLVAHRSEECRSDCGDYAEVPEGKVDVRLQIHPIFCFDLPRHRIHAVRELSDGERCRREGEEDQRDATHGRHARLGILVSSQIDRVFSLICAFIFQFSKFFNGFIIQSIFKVCQKCSRIIMQVDMCNSGYVSNKLIKLASDISFSTFNFTHSMYNNC